jgi:N-acetylated-alpha-linked acidic dipeptidase
MGIFENLRSAVDPAHLRAHLEWFAGVRRDTGGPGEDAAAKYIAEQLRAAGVEVRVHEFPAFLSYPREAALEAVDAAGAALEPFPCVTHSFAVSTPAEGIVEDVVLVGAGGFAGAAGKIAVVDGLCTPVTVLEASKAGVKGLVFINQGDVVHNMIATTIWGTPSADQLDRLPTVSAVSVSRPDGERLKARLAQGGVRLRLTARVETGWYTSKLPEAIVRGNGPDADKFVLVGAHYCSWEIGITDNATGDACLLEMARVLQQNRELLDRSVRLCWWPGHSHGRYSGSAWYADSFFDDLAQNCVAYHNVDSPGVRDATLYVARHTTAEIEEFCVELIGSLTGQTRPPVHRPSRAADQSFLANGVPSFSTYPFLPEDHPERKPWTGGCGNAWWWHSSADTLDKADVNVLTLDTQISATGVALLSTADVLPLNPVRSAQEVLAYAREFAQATAGHLDGARFVAAAEALVDAAGKLRAAAEAVRGGPIDVRRRVNDALMAFSRLVTSTVYSKGGRFTHDPAEWSPIMRNTRSGLFPGLNPGLTLSQLRGTFEYGFVLTGVVRQLNRTVDALRSATALCLAASGAALTPARDA